ncbi:MAG: hypothetical protein IH945_11330 [Armatimonadetes bacterium]|nr:hypothetical protein [Armatimonadota bacterium]
MKRLMLGIVAVGIASVAPAQFFDMFNRADSSDFGTDWTQVVPTTQIVSNEATNGTTSDGLSIVTGVNEAVATSVVSVDAFAVAGGSNHVAVVIGFAGVGLAQALYAKIWDTDGDGLFDAWGMMEGNDFTGVGGRLTVETASARISVWSPNPTGYVMGIDRDFDGVIDETHGRGGMSAWSGSLGTGIGLGIHGGAIADNYSQGFGLTEVEVLPSSFTVLRGVLTGGGLSDLFVSDDQRLVVRAGLTLFAGEPPLQVEFTGTSPVDVPVELRFTFEASVNTPGLTQTLQLFNYVTSLYEQVDLTVPGGSDGIVVVTVTTNPEHFVQAGTKEMKAKVIYQQVGFTLLWPWSASLDQALWTIVP